MRCKSNRRRCCHVLLNALGRLRILLHWLLLHFLETCQASPHDLGYSAHTAYLSLANFIFADWTF